MKQDEPGIVRQVYGDFIPIFILLAVYSVTLFLAYDVPKSLFGYSLLGIKGIQTVLYLLAAFANFKRTLKYSRITIKFLLVLHVVAYVMVIILYIINQTSAKAWMPSGTLFILAFMVLNFRRKQLRDIQDVWRVK
jgi:hypothetical protein